MTEFVLTGFMGSGKTTIGRLMAEMLHCPHIDLDEAIVAKAGKSISRIFAEEGEPYFRDLETQLLAAAVARAGILSTGGGTPVRMENNLLLRRIKTPVIFLETSPEMILERLKNDRNRPLVQALDPDKLLQLYRERESCYRQSADFRISTDRKTPIEIVREIMERAHISAEDGMH
ncbi:shikimate kinase [Sporolactobacillus vineae]|uniref:shikimate kinase n=1 Tax=Sporolactobacillus vineae TaxID=444463 RepID=UPI00028A13DF|nr:shikimate kinase [Sporolactobacillus vineae]